GRVVFSAASRHCLPPWRVLTTQWVRRPNGRKFQIEKTPEVERTPAMTEAYIYDAVRTPRGKGKSDGSLHEVTPVELASQVLAAIRDRSDIDAAAIEDVAFGCVSPVGEQGAVVTRTAVLNAGYPETTSGI